MGYDIYITRSNDWMNNRGRKIPYAEWERVVECDPELELDRETRATIAEKWRSDQEQFAHDPEYSESLRPEDEDDQDIFMEYVNWMGHPTAGENPWFCYCDGNIDTKSPDWPTLRKMLRLAEALGATVQGQEGEIYRLTDRGIECCQRNQAAPRWQLVEER
jgi:hypothetical protein